jgi:hypothetical protein
MNFLQKLEEEFYIALVRSAVDSERVNLIRQRAIRNGVLEEDLNAIFSMAQYRSNDMGFVTSETRPKEVKQEPVSPDGLSNKQLFCRQGSISISTALYQGERVFTRDLDNSHILAVQKKAWVVEEEGRAQKLLGSAFFLQRVDRFEETIIVRAFSGKLLSQVIQQQGKIAPDRAIAMAHQILEGLEELQQKGLRYRYPDSSRMVVDNEKILFLDWGTPLASKFDPFYAPPSQASYLPPEHPNTAGIQSDIYAFGILLLEIFTGKADPQCIPQLPTKRLRKVVQKCLQRLPQGRYKSFEAIRKALIKKPSRLWMLWSSIALLLAVGGGVYYWATELRTETMYVIGTNVHLRQTSQDWDRLPDKKSFGDKVEVRKIEGEFATIRENGRTLYFPQEYLVDQQSFNEINAIYGNMDARAQLVSSYQRLAIWNYFKTHNLIGDLKPDEHSYPTHPEIWQFLGRQPSEMTQSFFSGEFQYKYGAKYDWMGVIIDKKETPSIQRRFLLFSFNSAHQPTLEFEFDLSPLPNSYFRLVNKSRELRAFDKKYLAEVSAQRPGILFEVQNAFDPHLVVFHQGKFVWIDPIPKTARHKGEASYTSDYHSYKAEFDLLKDNIRKYYLTLDAGRKQQLLQDIPRMLRQYELVMDNADRRFLETNLIRIAK